ncbi:O-antigen ligase like membrane family protein [Synechococcus sp. A18-40]|nr:O-antigen ligase like membrane family protein [Synechococcus sp. A18-40]
MINKYLSTLFAFFFFLSLSITGAFSFSKFLHISIVASLALIFSSLLGLLVTSHKISIRKQLDFYPLLYTIYAISVGLLLPNKSTFNYSVVFIFLFPLLYFSIRYLLDKLGLVMCLKLNFIAFILISTIPLVEFLANYFLSFSIQNFIYRPYAQEARALVNAFINRSYGLSNEPTQLAGYTLSMGGLAVYYAYLNSSRVFIITTVIYTLTLITTFSSGALAAIIIASTLLLARYLLNLLHSLKIKTLPFILILCVISMFSYILTKASTFGTVYKLVEFSQGVDSGRLGYWTIALTESYKNAFLPLGLGASGANDIIIANTYLLILFDLGFIGLILYLIFPLKIYISILYTRLTPHASNLLLFILITAYSAQLSYSTFYYPYAMIAGIFIFEITLFHRHKKIVQ